MFRQSGVVHSFEVVGPVLFDFYLFLGLIQHVLTSENLNEIKSRSGKCCDFAPKSCDIEMLLELSSLIITRLLDFESRYVPARPTRHELTPH